MGLHRDTPVTELSNQALLDQHRTCHSYISQVERKKMHVLKSLGRSEILRIHLLTVEEMLKRGMQHTTPLQKGRTDFEEASRLGESTLLVQVGHPQMLSNARCPICTKSSSIRISKSLPGTWECRHCMQRFTSRRENLALFANADPPNQSESESYD